MKQLSLLSMLLALLLLFPNCEKESQATPDPCAGCVAPRQCINGDCVDPCATVDCGDLECRNGECICPTGFTGANCNMEALPSRVEVTSIRILDFQAKRDDGTDWDQGQADATGPLPDIYPWPDELLGAGTNPYRGMAKVEATPDSVYVFDLSGSTRWFIDVDPDKLDELRGFGLWDRDEGLPEDEYFFNPMGFLPYEPGRPGFPVSDTLIIENADKGSRAEVIIRYEF